jgi:CheY-like chemotaxis protein
MKRRYLLVDDNLAFAENVAEILGDLGAEVTQAGDAPHALDALSRERFDVMMTDMKMPGVSGTELLRLVRERDPGLPVVLVSAYTGADQLQEARRLGLLAFVAKTAGPEELISLLSHAQRDAVALVLTDDDARLEQLREGLARRGITVVSEDLGAVSPRAIVHDEGCRSLARVRARFPKLPVLSAAGPLDDLASRLEGLTRQ